jgi:hypothetical protein
VLGPLKLMHWLQTPNLPRWAVTLMATQQLDRESRPGHQTEAAPRISTPIKTLVSLRRQWAYGLIRRVTSPCPSYGSRAWLDLPEGDPAKIAAVVVAAEAWAIDGDDLERRLHEEVRNSRAAFKATEDEEYQARAAEHRRTAPRFTGLSFAERRTAQIAAAAPRDDDYQGARDDI